MFSKKIIMATLCLGTSLATSPVLAQESSNDGGIEDIVVTAQKREENVQKVGIAIQAYGAERLSQLGANTSTAIGEFTPGVSISGSSGGQNLNVSIRGVTQNDYNDVVESPNAIYMDDGYLPFQGAQAFALLDIERVEVQKGPQGTLFGRNATGGLVQYISKKPSFDGYSGYIDVQTGIIDSAETRTGVTVQGAVGGPLTDKIAFRVAAKYDRQDGYLINRYPQGQTIGPVSGDGSDLGGERSISLRGILLFEPTDTFSSQITGFMFRRRMSTAPFEMASAAVQFDANGTWVDTVDIAPNETRLSIRANGSDGGWDPNNTGVFTPGPPRPLPGGDYFGYRQGAANTTSSAHAFDDAGHVYLYGVDMKNVWDISDAVTVTSVSDYKQISKRDHTNAIGSPTPAIFPSIGTKSWAFSQELRANGSSDRFNWQAGLFYLHVDNTSSGALALGLAGVSVNALSKQITNSYSVFGQADWAFADGWKLIAGLRYTREKKSVDFQQALFAYSLADELYVPLRVSDPGFIAPIGPYPDGSGYADKSSDPLWAGKLQLEYSPSSDVLVYAGVNRGVKAGGFNAPLPGGIPVPVTLMPYKPEVLWNYEAGVKSSWFNNRLRANLSVFHYDYQNYQAFLFAGVGGIVINNDAKMTGGELTIEARPARGFDITAGVSYTHARVYDVPTDVTYAVVRDKVQPSYTPPWRASIAARYSHDFLGGTLSENATVTYRDPLYFSIRNFSAIKDKSHTKLGLGIDWLDAAKRLTLRFSVENVTNERIKTTIFDVASVCGCTVVSYERPRTFLASARYSF